MNELRFKLHAVGIIAPGITCLEDLLAAARANSRLDAAPVAPLPVPTLLPANERRRSSQVVRLALACVEQAARQSPFSIDTLRAVFATDEGTGEISQQMLEVLATTRQVSPLLFANSVHNAPSGYFSIAWSNRQPATVVTLGQDSFASGLLCAVSEALTEKQPVLLVVYDPAMTSPMDELLPVREAVATAWILSAGDVSDTAHGLGSFALMLEKPDVAEPTDWPAWLPESWQTRCSARSLHALALLAAPPDTTLRFTLGAQRLVLRRLPESAAGS